MQEFLTVAFLQLLAVMAPGPDFALTLKNAILYPRKIALLTALGVALGILVHTTYCIFGLAVVIASSKQLFNLIKIIGSGYLIYIGVQSFLAKDPKQTQHFSKAIELNTWKALRQGFLCNVLNPKAGLFFLGLFTLVVKPTTPIAVQFAYCVEMVVVTFAWFGTIVLLLQHRTVQVKLVRAQHYIMKILGVLLILFGVRLLFLTH